MGRRQGGLDARRGSYASWARPGHGGWWSRVWLHGLSFIVETLLDLGIGGRDEPEGADELDEVVVVEFDALGDPPVLEVIPSKGHAPVVASGHAEAVLSAEVDFRERLAGAVFVPGWERVVLFHGAETRFAWDSVPSWQKAPTCRMTRAFDACLVSEGLK